MPCRQSDGVGDLIPRPGRQLSATGKATLPQAWSKHKATAKSEKGRPALGKTRVQCISVLQFSFMYCTASASTFESHTQVLMPTARVLRSIRRMGRTLAAGPGCT